MKKVFGIVLALVLTMSIAVPASAHTQSEPYVVDLIAGQHYDAGSVSVWNDSENLYVQYAVDPGWNLGLTHLAASTSLSGIPQTKKGGPIPGKFKFDKYLVGPGYYVVPLSKLKAGAGDELYIAAHGEVTAGSTGTPTLPAKAYMTVSAPYPDAPSYLPEILVSGGTELDGTYPGWCLDADKIIVSGVTYYNTTVHSSYAALPEGMVEQPGNMDLLNWVLNQEYVGQPSPSGGVYTYGDVQAAIWLLVDNGLPRNTTSLGSWSQERTDEIVAAAYASGEGFIPGCGDSIWIIIAPVINIQPIVIPLQIACGSDETVWAAGYDFPGSNWAMYFTYTVQ